MTPIEILALIVVVLGIIKLVFISANPNSWMKVVKSVYAKPMFTTIFSLVLAAVVLYYLLAEMTIVHVFGATLFVMFLMLAGYATFSKELLDMVTNLTKKRNTMRRAWLMIVIWIALMIWVLYTLFF